MDIVTTMGQEPNSHNIQYSLLKTDIVTITLRQKFDIVAIFPIPIQNAHLNTTKLSPYDYAILDIVAIFCCNMRIEIAIHSLK